MSNLLTFTLIQTNLHWEDKAANMHMLQQKIDAINVKTEIVVLPEMFSTGFSMQPAQFAETMDGPTMDWMRNIAMQRKVVLTGSIIIEEDGKYYNRLIWMLPNGLFGFYNKRHCFGFAGEDKHYTAGYARLITSANGWKINVQVCYDLRFPVWARQATLNKAQTKENPPEYDVLLYVANWPERRNHPWKTLLAARAIENQAYVIGVNRVGYDGNNIYHSGDTMVINPLGETMYHKAHIEDVFTITLNKEDLNETRSKFPFLRDADSFTITN